MTKEEHAKVLAALENSIAVGYDPFGAAKRHDEATAIMRKEPQGWMPIETAPKDGTAIMLGARCGAWIGKYLPIYQSGYKPENPWSSLMLNHDHLSEKRYSPTHWMPLPPPPGKEPEPISDAEKWKQAVMLAYGHLWHVNNEPMAPIPMRSPEKAAYAARKVLLDLLTHEERGLAINEVRALLEKK